MQGMCGTCKYHRRDKDGDWICANKESEYYSDWTAWADGCECCEARGNQN